MCLLSNYDEKLRVCWYVMESCVWQGRCVIQVLSVSLWQVLKTPRFLCRTSTWVAAWHVCWWDVGVNGGPLAPDLTVSLLSLCLSLCDLQQWKVLILQLCVDGAGRSLCACGLMLSLPSPCWVEKGKNQLWLVHWIISSGSREPLIGLLCLPLNSRSHCGSTLWHLRDTLWRLHCHWANYWMRLCWKGQLHFSAGLPVCQIVNCLINMSVNQWGAQPAEGSASGAPAGLMSRPPAHCFI